MCATLISGCSVEKDLIHFPHPHTTWQRTVLFAVPTWLIGILFLSTPLLACPAISSSHHEPTRLGISNQIVWKVIQCFREHRHPFPHTQEWTFLLSARGCVAWFQYALHWIEIPSAEKKSQGQACDETLSWLTSDCGLALNSFEHLFGKQSLRSQKHFLSFISVQLFLYRATHHYLS